MTDKPNSRKASTMAAMLLTKAIIQDESEEKNETNPVVIVNINKNKTKSKTKNKHKNEPMGFIASSGIITNLINLISLPLAKDRCEFDKIVLHFDNTRKEIWWSNETTDGGLVNFGHASYDYFADCWGNGEAVLYASYFFDVLKWIEKAKQVKLVVYPNKYGGGRVEFRYYCDNLFPIVNNSPDDTISGMSISRFPILDASSEINTQMPRVDYKRNKSKNPLKLDDYYIPIRANDEALEYGGTIDASDLKTVVVMGRKLGIKTYPIDFKKTTPNLIDIKSEQIKIKKGSLIPLNVDISHIISEKIEAPSMALEGDVILRLSKTGKSPFYLLKEEKSKVNPNGVLSAGMLFG